MGGWEKGSKQSVKAGSVLAQDESFSEITTCCWEVPEIILHGRSMLGIELWLCF